MRSNHRISKSKYSLISFAVIFILFLLFRYTDILPFEKGDSSNQAVTTKKQLTSSGYNVVHFLDAGQGDCTLIETIDGKYALIDSSTQEYSDKIVKYLKDQGVSELEYVFFTHPHEDHIGGGDEVLDNFKVKNIIMTKRTENTASYKNLISSIKKSRKNYGTKVISPVEGDVFMLSDTVFTVISDGKGYEDLNNSSICLMMELGESSFLFTGDAERIVEEDILKGGADIDADIYKCAHHGSSTSNTKAFIETVNPDYAIISCGKDNDYGHPHKEVVSLLNKKGITMLITHEEGDILIGYNAHSIIVK